jgi:hypothetical protein
MKVVIVLYGIYLASITILNLTFKETTGEITSVYQYAKTSFHPNPRFGEITIRENIVHYKYSVNKKNYVGERKTNLLIYPAMEFKINQKTTVYYFPLFAEYSVLYKGSLLYTFYNLIPLIILGIVLFKVSKKYDLKIFNSKKVKDESSENDDEDNHNLEMIDMGNVFAEEIKNGEKAIPFLDVIKSSDEIVIESIFNSEQIPHIIKQTIKSKTEKYRTFYILEKDYADAFFLIEEYIKNKSDKERKDITIRKKSLLQD